MKLLYFVPQNKGPAFDQQLVVCKWRHQKHDNEQFALNFGRRYRIIQCASVPNLELFRSIKTELWTEEVGEFSVMLYPDNLG